MEESAITAEDPAAAVEAWYEALAGCVNEEAFDVALGLVAPQVVSFGTKAEVVEGREALRSRQWEGIWPYIREFRFVDVRGFGAGDVAWGVGGWSSTGFDEAGEPFERPGRATVVLERKDGRWWAVHTHFSLAPGIPQQTYGPGGDGTC